MRNIEPRKSEQKSPWPKVIVFEIVVALLLVVLFAFIK
jgi:hypothetical protein